MSGEPKISVIIPIYNTAAYLPRCLDSILRNTYQSLEIICVNDGSTDDSAVILERYAAADSRIIAVNQENAGVSAARNTGLDMATGDFIAFVDSDDWVHPQYFEVLINVQVASEADVVVCDYLTASGDADSYCDVSAGNAYMVYPSPYKALQIGSVRRLTWGRIYSRNCVGSCTFRHELSWGEDTDFNQRVLCSSAELKIAHIHETLYFYFQRGDSLTNTIGMEDRSLLTKAYLTYLETEDLSADLVQMYLSEACKGVLAYRYSEMFNPDRQAVQAECRTMVQRCRDAQKQYKCIAGKKWITFSLLFRFPLLYRLFRLIDDPTLFQWEKTKRKDRERACDSARNKGTLK